VIDEAALAAATSREPFDHLGYEMLARGGLMAEQVVVAVQNAAAPAGLSLDEAVVGGLLVRMTKLLRGVFDATQADESEAHLALSRCVAETAVTLRRLARFADATTFRRFRADSFAYLRGRIAKFDAEEEQDDVQRAIADRVRRHAEAELHAAGVDWDDVPIRTNSWGPDMRQRCKQLGQDWVYDAFFASHSS
jgi:hypothetical protein